MLYTCRKSLLVGRIGRVTNFVRTVLVLPGVLFGPLIWGLARRDEISEPLSRTLPHVTPLLPLGISEPCCNGAERSPRVRQNLGSASGHPELR